MAGERTRPEVSLIDLQKDLTGEAREKFEALSKKIAEDYADVPMEEGLAEIDAAVARERRGEAGGGR